MPTDKAAQTARQFGASEAAKACVRAIAAGEDDGPVLMLNINRYTTEAGYPDGPASTE
jgi:hypothetical protein